jgi:hypothetical protein
LWMARLEIDASSMSPGCGTHGDAPLHRVRHALERTTPRRGARRPPLGDELDEHEEMAELGQ